MFDANKSMYFSGIFPVSSTSVNLYQKVGDQPVLKYHVRLADAQNIFIAYQIRSSSKVLLTILYDSNGPITVPVPNGSSWASTADIDNGQLHLRLDPLHTGDEGLYVLAEFETVLNETYIYLLGTLDLKTNEMDIFNCFVRFRNHLILTNVDKTVS